MGIMEKLKGLVSLTKQEKEDISQKTDFIEEITKEDTAVVEEDTEEAKEIPEEESVEYSPDYLECTQDETLLILKILKEGELVKKRLAELVLQFEAKKQLLLSQVGQAQKKLHEELNSLRLEYGLPDSGYSVEISDEEEEEKKVVFIKG